VKRRYAIAYLMFVIVTEAESMAAALDHHGPCMRRLDRCTHAHNINDQTVKFSIRVKLNSSELELDLESEILDVQVTWVVKHSAQHPPWPSSAGP
jgi:hypothetical protein